MPLPRVSLLLAVLASQPILGAGETAAPIAEMMPRPGDFTRMWWADGFPSRVPEASWERVIQTGSYAFAMETDTLRITHLGPLDSEKNYADSARTPADSWRTLPPANLSLEISVNGQNYQATAGGPWSRFAGPRLIESGRFFQRADITDLVFTDAKGNRLNTKARLETAAWPDRLSFTLAARPGLENIRPGEESFGRIGGGFGLDGSNHLEVAHSPELEPEKLTLELWAYVPENFNSATKAYPWIACKNSHEEAVGNYGFSLVGGRVQARLNVGGGRANAFTVESPNQLKIEAWSHLAMTYDGETLRLFVNGEAAGERVIGRPRQPGKSPLAFGRRQDNSGDGYHFRGVLDEVRLHGRALSADEIRASFKLLAQQSNSSKPLKEWSFQTKGTELGRRPLAPWKNPALKLNFQNSKTGFRSVAVINNQEDLDPEAESQVSLVFDPASFEKLGGPSSVTVQAAAVNGGKVCPVTYESAPGWHRVDLDGIVPIVPPGPGERRNDAVERVRLVLTNPSDKEEVARLLFAKESGGIRHNIGAAITGVSAILRDPDGNPTGIPVQLSKNWHKRPEGDVYEGPWFHGISQVRLPSRCTAELELTLAYGHWGSVPAASHAQLSLIGWGSNQLWDQSAVGAWGESICYEPDQAQASATVTDVRPLMVKGMNKGGPWEWTHNVGGADFFRLFDAGGKRIAPSAMRTTYLRQGPCLTEVVYSGQLGPGLRHSETVSLSRTDDITRGTYRLRLDVTQPVDFTRLVVFQIGADTYSYTGEKLMASGDGSILTREWATQWGGDVYRTKPVELSGTLPWVSLHQAVARSGKKEDGAWANRGVVLRSWKARLGGREAGPWFAEHGAKVGGKDTSTADFLPPPGLTRLEAGDFVEAVFEHVIIPQSASDYHGPNEALRKALEKHADTWRMVSREAVENHRNVKVAIGALESLHPAVTVRAANNVAEFTLTGGLGHVPVTITGLTFPPKSTLLVDGKAFDQSVHGNDFWQTDYDPTSKTWSVTYNLPASGELRSVRFSAIR